MDNVTEILIKNRKKVLNIQKIYKKGDPHNETIDIAFNEIANDLEKATMIITKHINNTKEAL